MVLEAEVAPPAWVFHLNLSGRPERWSYFLRALPEYPKTLKLCARVHTEGGFA